MKDTKCDKEQREHGFIKVLGITALAILLLLNTAVAMDISVTTPDFPSIALPIATIIGLLAIIGRKINV